MWSVRRRIKLSICLLFCFVEVTQSTCDPQCVRCVGGACVKCVHLIVEGSRACVDACPAGAREEWSPLVDYMGRVCRERSFLGLPRRALAALAGAGGGAGLCALAALCAALLLRFRRRRRLHHRRPNLAFPTSSQPQTAVGSTDKQLFLKYLSILRCEAPVFLAMLNDTRRHLRELHNRENYNSSALQIYRPVLRDLARILFLLNRSENQIINPPVDWSTLLIWGENVLRTYKMQHPQQVAQVQLPSFLQTSIPTRRPPSPGHQQADCRRRELTTFQPLSPNVDSQFPRGSVSYDSSRSADRAQPSSLQELLLTPLGSECEEATDDLCPLQPHSMQSSTTETYALEAWPPDPSLLDTADFDARWAATPAMSTHALHEWLPLGMRPQDEITTEL